MKKKLSTTFLFFIVINLMNAKLVPINEELHCDFQRTKAQAEKGK